MSKVKKHPGSIGPDIVWSVAGGKNKRTDLSLHDPESSAGFQDINNILRQL
jgi:hypothetical protein